MGLTKPIDLEQVEALAGLGCTYEEMAGVLGVSRRTLISRAKRQDFIDAVERGQAKLKTSIRRAQVKALNSGNPTMMIWLGKQYLGQRDVVASEHTGPAGGPIEHNVTTEMAREKLARMLEEAAERVASVTVTSVPKPNGTNGAANGHGHKEA